MLPCIPRTKHQNDDHRPESSRKAHTTKSLSSQFKKMALRASGAYRHCNTCTGGESTNPKHKPNSTFQSDANPIFNIKRSSYSGTVVFVEEMEPREWVAQVEPGVLITFLSLVGGGNHLERIRFSKEKFDKTQAQKWWTDNFDKVMELYNVQRLDCKALPFPTPPRSENEIVKAKSEQEIPATPPLNRECPPRTFSSPTGTGTGYSSSDSLEQQSHRVRDSAEQTTPTQPTISPTKTETSSLDASKTTSSSRENSLSVSNASDMESEWVEEDEPGVYITIKSLPNGTRELMRVRFSREKFDEMHARVWWEENRKRVHEKYL